MEIGTRVRIVLKEVKDGIDASINGAVGIVESCNYHPKVPFEYCVRISSLLVGANAEDLERIDDDQTTTSSE